jgi:hypothetical protein
MFTCPCCFLHQSPILIVSAALDEVVPAVKNGILKHLPVKHILLCFDDILYSLINRVQIPVSDDDLGCTSVLRIPSEVE